ncbi:MAG: DNA-binding response regulator [Candidatus Hydromicrobium americanum]|nr:MAG: DNA-binding response regulator [Candidatus Hydromicrobium americanum]
MRLLIIEDQKKLVTYLRKGLENNSFSVDFAYDGQKGEKLALYGEYDLIILDIMLPIKDGIEVCKTLRRGGIDTPILMLTAKEGVDDRINGLDSGADDYLIKPFAFGELLARIRALLRRPTKKDPEILKGQDIVMNNSTHVVKKGNEILNLTLKEYSVLEYLIKNKGIVLDREKILDHCWDFAYDSFSNIVDVYIKRIRKKLDNKNHEKYIQTIRGMGYKFKK